MASKKSVKSLVKKRRKPKRVRSANNPHHRIVQSRRERRFNAFIIAVPLIFLIIVGLLCIFYLIYPSIYNIVFNYIGLFFNSVNFSDIMFLRITSLALFLLSMSLVIVISIMLLKRVRRSRSESSIRQAIIKSLKKDHTGHLLNDEEEEVKERGLKDLKPEIKVLSLSERSGSSATDMDRLYDLIKDRKRMKLAEIAKKFHVSKDKALEWCRLLEEYNLVKIIYHALKEPEVEVE